MTGQDSCEDGARFRKCRELLRLSCNHEEEIGPEGRRLAERITGRLLRGSATYRRELDEFIRLLEQDSCRLREFSSLFCRASSPRCVTCPLSSLCTFAEKRSRLLEKENYAIDLFAGAGGLTLGLKRAGIPVIFAVEKDRSAAQTYRLNHPEVQLFEADVREMSISDLPGADMTPPLAVVAGPPCQGYSVAGRRSGNDPANHLYLEIIRLCAEMQPRFIVIENVPGLKNVKGLGFQKEIVSAIRDVGYVCGRPHMLNAENFGVPQRRKRLLFIGQHERHQASVLAPRATHSVLSNQTNGLSGTPTVKEALAGLPELGSGAHLERGMYEGRPIFNASTMAHSAEVIAKIKKIEPGEGPISYRRLDLVLARTIIAGHRALPVHPWLDRTISVREAARLQGFPDDFVFAGPRSHQPLQVANAVPPPMAEAIGKTLLQVAEE